MIKYGNITMYVSEPPTEKELKRLTVSELVLIAKSKRSIQYPLKKYLIACIMKSDITINADLMPF